MSPNQQTPALDSHSIEAITQRIAKAIAHPLRVRILVALNEGVMGPAAFARCNPDVELSDASQHFRRLRDLGCIELLGRRDGRGGERVYRAVRRAMFDLSSWRAVPSSKRAEVTEQAFLTYLKRVDQAAEAGTLDSRDERWVSWTSLLFDEAGWRELINAIEHVFARSLELGIEARLRLAKNPRAETVPATVGLFCFESPSTDGGDLNRPQYQPTAPPGSFENSFLGLRSPKALATPLRIRILVELNRRQMSPKAFYTRFPIAPLEHIATEFRRLEHFRCIERVVDRKRPVTRGRPEQVFRAVRRSLFDEETWKELPQSLRTDVTSITYTTFIERVSEAAQANVLDAREDRHLSWSGLRFDLPAWREMLGLLKELFALSLRVHEETQARTRMSTDGVIPVTVAMSCFESPRDAPIVGDAVIRKYLDE
jgi:DNA-binding transcriptional ArsR family regulator